MILVVLIVAILGVVGYFAYDTLNAKKIDNNAQSALDEFENATKVVKKKVNKNDQNEVSNETSSSLEDIANQLATDEENKRAEEEKNKEEKEPEVAYYEGYEIKGKIEIPATKVNYPVLESVTKKSLEIAVGIAYGPGLNEVGNTSIYGHNYRNGTFFSNNKKLKNGDEIKITDQKGEEVTYIIYKIYETDANDATYMTRDTQGRREISLQTCTDDSKARIIIWAAEKGSEVPQQ